MALGDISVNDSLLALQVQRIDKPVAMQTDPTPDRVASMRKRLMEIKVSMDSVDIPDPEQSEPQVPPVLRQRTFTVEKKGKDELQNQRPVIDTNAPKPRRSSASTGARVNKANVKRLDYYKPRAAVTAPRIVDTNRVHTKTSYKINKNVIKKSLLESLETSTIDGNNNGLGKENAITKPASFRVSKIPVKIPSYVLKKPLDLDARMTKLHLPATPIGSKIPVSPKFKASFM